MEANAYVLSRRLWTVYVCVYELGGRAEQSGLCSVPIIVIVIVVRIPKESFSDKLSCRHQPLSVGTLRHSAELSGSFLLLSQHS